jgi:hypothetical protein
MEFTVTDEIPSLAVSPILYVRTLLAEETLVVDAFSVHPAIKIIVPTRNRRMTNIDRIMIVSLITVNIIIFSSFC